MVVVSVVVVIEDDPDDEAVAVLIGEVTAAAGFPMAGACLLRETSPLGGAESPGASVPELGCPPA